MVFQNYALYPHMRVWDNLAFALKLRRVPKPAMRERVGSVAGVLGLKELIDRKPGALSGGQRQRVAIGRAMVREPEAYLMDEPLSNLDAKLRVGMRAELARLHDRLGTTTVYVTHDQVEAMTLGDRVAVLRDGTVQQCDTPERAVRRARQRLRGRLHRHAADEPRAGRGARRPPALRRGRGPAGRRRRRAARSSPACAPPTSRCASRRRRRPPGPAARSSRWSSGSAPRATSSSPWTRPRLTGAAAAAADEATAEDEATLLADDRRARFTAVVQGRRRFAPGDTVELDRASRRRSTSSTRDGAALRRASR